MTSLSGYDPFAERGSRFRGARDNAGARGRTRRRSYSAYLPLPPLTFHVLLSLVEGPCHGYEIRHALWENGFRGITPHHSSVYRRLHRLQEQEWIVRLKGHEEPPSAGPLRRTYRLTEEGLELLETELDRLDRVLRLAAHKLARRAVEMRQGGGPGPGTEPEDDLSDPFEFDLY